LGNKFENDPYAKNSQVQGTKQVDIKSIIDKNTEKDVMPSINKNRDIDNFYDAEKLNTQERVKSTNIANYNNM
jgi:hypothetical protein